MTSTLIYEGVHVIIPRQRLGRTIPLDCKPKPQQKCVWGGGWGSGVVGSGWYIASKRLSNIIMHLPGPHIGDPLLCWTMLAAP